MAKSMTMYLNIELEDEKKLFEMASKVYRENCFLDLNEEIKDYPEMDQKIVRALFEVLVGSGENRPYIYSDAGFILTGFGDE